MVFIWEILGYLVAIFLSFPLLGVFCYCFYLGWIRK